MCCGCKYANGVGVGYFIQYICLLLNNQISETVDTYFNTRSIAVKCPLK